MKYRAIVEFTLEDEDDLTEEDLDYAANSAMLQMCGEVRRVDGKVTFYLLEKPNEPERDDT